VVPAECKYEVLKTKLEIRLKKAVPTSWPTLQKSAEKVATNFADPAVEQTPAYPSSFGGRYAGLVPLRPLKFRRTKNVDCKKWSTLSLTATTLCEYNVLQAQMESTCRGLSGPLSKNRPGSL
jgi:hypothetical protein